MPWQNIVILLAYIVISLGSYFLKLLSQKRKPTDQLILFLPCCWTLI
ncbi:hypothetical protein PPBDW_II0996 [Photobacterium kishitanii]|nr:hypothetical protein PPBDW_II0996 [Photobacterium kishitanii]